LKFSLGLTGGIGVGKSTVLKIFEEFQFRVINADNICRAIYEDEHSEIHLEIKEKWGNRFITGNGKVNKKKVAKRIFSDNESLEWLNSRLHPVILQRAKKLLDGYDGRSVFEVPLLFEAGWGKLFKKIIVVYTADDIRRKRLLQKGMTLEEINERINAQAPQDKKLEKADFALINNGNIISLKEQVSKLITNETIEII